MTRFANEQTNQTHQQASQPATRHDRLQPSRETGGARAEERVVCLPGAQP